TFSWSDDIDFGYDTTTSLHFMSDLQSTSTSGFVPAPINSPAPTTVVAPVSTGYNVAPAIAAPVPSGAVDSTFASLATQAATSGGFAEPMLHRSANPFRGHGGGSGGGPAGYHPNQIQHAYGFDQLIAGGTDGRGQTIYIIDAYDDPYIVSDLNTFS